MSDVKVTVDERYTHKALAQYERLSTDVLEAVSRFRTELASFRNDERADMSGFNDSACDNLVFRCLLEANSAVMQATVSLGTYHAGHRNAGSRVDA